MSGSRFGIQLTKSALRGSLKPSGIEGWDFNLPKCFGCLILKPGLVAITFESSLASISYSLTALKFPSTTLSGAAFSCLVCDSLNIW